MIFIVVGPDAVISFVMRSEAPWKMLLLDTDIILMYNFLQK